MRQNLYSCLFGALVLTGIPAGVVEAKLGQGERPGQKSVGQVGLQLKCLDYRGSRCSHLMLLTGWEATEGMEGPQSEPRLGVT